MSERRYEVAHVDELEELPVQDFVWRPVRRRFGITAFGTNAYTADAGRRVVEEHSETQNGHEELYVVLRGRAAFTLDGDEVDAPAGTLVFVQPGTRRGAVAQEDGTAVLVVGAKAGAAFVPSAWEETFAAISYAERGDLATAREAMSAAIARHPDAWQGHYNAACIEAKHGDADTAIAHLQRAAELDAGQVAEYARGDADFDAIREDPRFSAIAG